MKVNDEITVARKGAQGKLVLKLPNHSTDIGAKYTRGSDGYEAFVGNFDLSQAFDQKTSSFSQKTSFSREKGNIYSIGADEEVVITQTDDNQFRSNTTLNLKNKDVISVQVVHLDKLEELKNTSTSASDLSKKKI